MNSARGQRLDLHPIDGGGVELPIEVGQGLAFRETGIADAVGDAPLAALVGLLADQRPQEFQVRHPFALGAGQHGVELLGLQRDSQRLEVLKDLLAQFPPRWASSDGRRFGSAWSVGSWSQRGW